MAYICSDPRCDFVSDKIPEMKQHVQQSQAGGYFGCPSEKCDMVFCTQQAVDSLVNGHIHKCPRFAEWNDTAKQGWSMANDRLRKRSLLRAQQVGSGIWADDEDSESDEPPSTARLATQAGGKPTTATSTQRSETQQDQDEDTIVVARPSGKPMPPPPTPSRRARTRFSPITKEQADEMALQGHSCSFCADSFTTFEEADAHVKLSNTFNHATHHIHLFELGQLPRFTCWGCQATVCTTDQLAMHLKECNKLEEYMEARGDHSYPRSDYHEFIAWRLMWDREDVEDLQRPVRAAHLSETGAQRSARIAKEAASLPKPIIAKVVALTTERAHEVRASRGMAKNTFGGMP